MKKKSLPILLFLLQVSMLACSNQGAFEVRESSDGANNVAYQALSRTDLILQQLNNNTDPMREAGLLDELRVSISDLNDAQSSIASSYQIQTEALESRWERLGCVAETNSGFLNLPRSKQEECRAINRELSDISTQRNHFTGRVGSIIEALSSFSSAGSNLASEDRNTPMSIIEIAVGINQLRTGIDAWRD